MSSEDKYSKKLPPSSAANSVPPNNESAQYCYDLGKCYYYGHAVAKDRSEAVTWFEKAAQQGHPAGQYRLAACYFHGHGVAVDKLLAAIWYGAAALQGYAPAQNDWAACCFYGYGVAEDKSGAVEWYRAAADQGYALAQNNLGVCYANGWGVAKNEHTAISWYQKAIKGGSQAASRNLMKLNKKITARNISIQSSAVSMNVNSLFNSLPMPTSTPAAESKEKISTSDQPKKSGVFG
jgi:TPR repeat protein